MDETPSKLFLETSLPTSASPYPSPSSAFYPPPIPASHEFANKLAGNKRYRGSGGAPGTSSTITGATTPNGTSAAAAAAAAAANTLTTPSSANSSRRGSASAPSPLATNPPLMAKLDSVFNASLEAAVKGSRPSAAAGGTLSPRDADATATAALSPSTPTPGVNGGSTASHDRIHPLEDAADAASTPTLTSHPPPNPPPSTTTPIASNPPHSDAHRDPTPSTPPRPTPSLTTITTTTSPSPASKRTSQILEVLTPTRAAPPSPGPSRRGSLIRRGSSRRWSATNSAVAGGGGGGGGTPGLAPAPGGGEEGYFGSAVNASEVPTEAVATTAASKRASRRLSAFNPLASTMEGQVATFSEITPGASAPTPAPIAKPDDSSSSNPILHTDTDTRRDGEAAKAAKEAGAPESSLDDEAEVEPAAQATEATDATEAADTAGASPCKPILVADFAFPEDDPRFSKRPLQLLSRAERAELGPDAAGYGGGRGEDDDDDDDDDDGDAWGWLSRPRPRVVEDEEEDEEEMIPRFGYSYGGGDSAHGYTNGTSTTGADGTPTTASTTTTTSLSATEDATTAGELDPDSPLPPGIYRALYAFEAEGTAEMSLAEGQLVRVVGRGGGVGWAVVERGWRPENANTGGGDPSSSSGIRVGGKLGGGGSGGAEGGIVNEESLGALGMAGQALVPEGYLDIWMSDGEEWDQEDDVGAGADADGGYQ